jgi:hypothetical protein
MKQYRLKDEIGRTVNEYDLTMQPIAKNSSNNFNNRGFLTYFEEL